MEKLRADITQWTCRGLYRAGIRFLASSFRIGYGLIDLQIPIADFCDLRIE